MIIAARITDVSTFPDGRMGAFAGVNGANLVYLTFDLVGDRWLIGAIMEIRDTTTPPP